MANTIQVTMFIKEDSIKEELIAQLSTIDFDAFEEKENELLAFATEEKFNETQLKGILEKYKIGHEKVVIKDQNWNALWESNFEPVIVEQFCAIRAEFHRPLTNVEHEIVITPKMSFGTGHHATTYMMISEMRRINFKGKKVADFGTGTGVLAILAEKLGAQSVWAIDNDEWSIENSKENIERNGCTKIVIEKSDGFKTDERFDVILANINKNIILENLPALTAALANRSQLLLSGLLGTDENDIIASFSAGGVSQVSTLQRNNWICILAEKT